MMPETNKPNMWVVVSVERGIPVSAHLCPSAEIAEEYERGIRAHSNELEDETAVFEVTEDGACTEVVFPGNRGYLGSVC